MDVISLEKAVLTLKKGGSFIFQGRSLFPCNSDMTHSWEVPEDFRPKTDIHSHIEKQPATTAPVKILQVLKNDFII